MTTIRVDADTLRAGGEKLTEQREALAREGNVHLLHGHGDHMHLSTGGFYPGVMAQQYLTHNYNRTPALFQAIGMDLTGLASGLHVVADLFETTDHAQAVEFAYANPEAGVPTALPWYLDPKSTLQQPANAEETAAGEPAASEGPDGAGTAEGGFTQRQTYLPGGPGVPPRWATEIVNSDGEVVRTEYRVVYPGGGYLYYTEEPSQDGPVRTIDFYVPPQTQPVAPLAVQEWILADQQEDLDRELGEVGADPDEGSRDGG